MISNFFCKTGSGSREPNQSGSEGFADFKTMMIWKFKEEKKIILIAF